MNNGRNYVRGKKNGQGKFIWPEKTVYVGEFRDNIIEGYGRHQWLDGKVYEGQWKNNRINGSGTMSWPDGKKYVGEFVNDKREGEGTMTWPDHRKYEVLTQHYYRVNGEMVDSTVAESSLTSLELLVKENGIMEGEYAGWTIMKLLDLLTIFAIVDSIGFD